MGLPAIMLLVLFKQKLVRGARFIYTSISTVELESFLRLLSESRVLVHYFICWRLNHVLR